VPQRLLQWPQLKESRCCNDNVIHKTFSCNISLNVSRLILWIIVTKKLDHKLKKVMQCFKTAGVNRTPIKFKVHWHFFYVALTSTMTSTTSPRLRNSTCYWVYTVLTAAQQRWPFPLWTPADAGTHLPAPKGYRRLSWPRRGLVRTVLPNTVAWKLLRLTGVEPATLRLHSQRLRPLGHHDPYQVDDSATMKTWQYIGRPSQLARLNDQKGFVFWLFATISTVCFNLTMWVYYNVQFPIL